MLKRLKCVLETGLGKPVRWWKPMEEGFSGDFSNQTEDLQAGLMGILLCRYEESQ